jgi:hypothetical protein
MSSVSRFLKQIPSDSQYFIAINPSTQLNLHYFTTDAASATTTYVSGAAAGYFTASNIPAANLGLDASGTLNIFRDMGKTILSSGRTFRRIQLLRLDGNLSTGVGGYAWTSAGTTNAGVWQPSPEGVAGNVAPSALIDTGFQNFYFETGARGLGIAQGLVRYG